MKIERLLFQINPPEFTKDFLQADSEVWNPWLHRQKGFLNKTTRIIPGGLVEILIHWASEAALEKASQKKTEISMVERVMRSRSPGTYNLIQSMIL